MIMIMNHMNFRLAIRTAMRTLLYVLFDSSMNNSNRISFVFFASLNFITSLM